MTTKRFIISCAVSDTRAHAGFLASMQSYAKEHDATLYLVAARYLNPTAKRGRAAKKRDATYDAAVIPYLTNDNIRLGANLTLFGDVPIQPTASNPTSGLEVLCAGTSAIVGHVKRALQTVPTSHRTPRVIWSTGACTLPKYSNSRAGARAKRHHVLGAVIVECEADGSFFVRNVTATKDGWFTDLDRVYTPKGSLRAQPATSVVLGDIHVGADDPNALLAARELVKTVLPRHLVLHDLYDGHARSHHRRSPRDRYASRNDTVEAEVSATAQALRDFGEWSAVEIDVVASNHIDHLSRWMDEHDCNADPANTPYWHKLWASVYDAYEANGVWPNELELECKRLGVPAHVRFLGREDSLVAGGVEHALHGDKGVNGSKGNINGYTKLGCKVTIGHSHTPGIRDGVFQVGVTAKLRMDYNHRPSTWLHAHCVLGADGKRQMVICQGKRFRADVVAAKPRRKAA